MLVVWFGTFRFIDSYYDSVSKKHVDMARWCWVDRWTWWP